MSSALRVSELRDRGTPNRAYARKASGVGVEEALRLYANPATEPGPKVTLIKPPIVFSKNSYSTPLTQPIGLTYLAALLQKAGYAAAILDCPGADPDHIELSQDGRFQVQGLGLESALRRIDPRSDIIGVTIMFSQEWPFVRDFLHQIRARFPNATLVVGGEHVTALSEFSLGDCPAIDYAVSGEGELAMLQLVHALRSGASCQEIPGVSTLSTELVESDRGVLAPRLTDVTSLPWPAWDLIDLNAYFRPSFTMGISHGRNMAMVATRGCPYQCTFCSNPTMWTTRYVMRDAKDVVDEIEHNVREHGCNSVDFYDLTAIVKRDWILEFTDELERRQLDVVWQLPSGTRSESIDDEVVTRLARTGCAFLVYAPESGSPRTLRQVKKRVDLEAMQESIRAAIRAGLVVKVNFILGFPFEERADMLQTLKLVWKLAWMKVDDCNISAFAPYPGSEIYSELVASHELTPPSDAYFHSLITQFDFTVQETVCRHVGSLEILIYRVLGMSTFYGLSYLRVPRRIGRLVRMLFSKEPPAPRSLFEQRVFDLLARRRSPVGSA